MTRLWVALRDWLDGRQLRERVLLFLAGAAIIAIGGYEGLLRPAMETEAALEQRTGQAQQEAEQYQNQMQQLTGTDYERQRSRLEDKASDLRSQLEQRRDALGEKVGRFIQPDRLMAFFEDLLLARDPSSIVVRRVESLEKEPVKLAGGGDGGAGPDIGLYRKGIAVGYQGTYEETVGFLDRIEALDWAVQVTKLDFSVLEYPRAEVSLTAHTFVLEFAEDTGD